MLEKVGPVAGFNATYDFRNFASAAFRQRPQGDPEKGVGVNVDPGGATDLAGGDRGDPIRPGLGLVERQSWYCSCVSLSCF